MSRTVTSVALAPHIESFPATGYKRPYGSIAGAPTVDGDYSAANQLAVPNGQIPGVSGPIPATTARQDRGVNACIPVARTCASHLTVGQVAFVYRSFKVPMKESSLGGLEQVISMEQLNERLALKENRIVAPSDHAKHLFEWMKAKHIYSIEDAQSVIPIRAKVFRKGVVKNSFHPYHQYALDGIVCTPADGDEYDNDGFKPHSTHQSKPACNVAVHGPCPLTVLHMPSIHEDFESVRVGVPSKARPAPNVFVQPARVLSEVYVALVASRESATSKEWTLQYQVVSSSNLDLDPNTSSGVRLFRSKELYEGIESSIAFVPALRLVVEVHRLGKVVDCRFGPLNAPQVVVAVNVKKYERTAYSMKKDVSFPGDVLGTKPRLSKPALVSPLPVWRSFVRLQEKRQLHSRRQDTTQQLGGALVKQRAPFGRLRNLTSTLAFGTPVQKADLDALKVLLLDRLSKVENAVKDSSKDAKGSKQSSDKAARLVNDMNSTLESLSDSVEDASKETKTESKKAKDAAEKALAATVETRKEALEEVKVQAAKNVVVSFIAMLEESLDEAESQDGKNESLTNFVVSVVKKLNGNDQVYEEYEEGP
jgi:hypothetical protein